MSDEKTIKKLNKTEFQQLITETLVSINVINSAVDSITKSKTEVEEVNNKINGEGGFASQIKEQAEEINEAYAQICEDGDGVPPVTSIKTQLEELVEKFEADETKIENFKKQIFGEKIKTKLGEEEKIPGLFENINDFHEKQKEKYGEFYAQIEEELKAGATSVNLSKSFANKVSEYHTNSVFWSWAFVGFLAVLLVFCSVDIWRAGEITSIQDIWFRFAVRAPFLAFAVWLAVFLGNRRAESKKLEESYKHKEVMARSFVGYKKTLEELDDEDETLLKRHMENLLEAMNENSSKFLNPEGEKHPLFETLSSVFSPVKPKDVDEKK